MKQRTKGITPYLGTKRLRKDRILPACITLLVMAFYIFPIYIALMTALKSPKETAESIMALPTAICWDNFITGMRKTQFGRAMVNSAIVTFPSVVLIVICSSMSGYTIARNGRRHKGIKAMDKVYLASMMIPFQVLMIPVYKMYKTLDLLNTRIGMILILTGVSIAYSTFLYVGFVKGIPMEIEEAALIDGCGPLRAFKEVVFPLLKPITATVASLHVMWLWNDFNMALILISKEEVRPLTVKQYYFFDEYSAQYGPAFAAAILGMIPVLLVFIVMQKHIVNGISAGAVKS